MKTLPVVFCTIMLLGVSTLSAAIFQEKKYEAGIASGFLMPGEVYISLHGDNVKQKSNAMLKGFADAYIIPQLAFGLYFSYTSLNLKNDIEVFGKTIKKSGTPIWEIGASALYNVKRRARLKWMRSCLIVLSAKISER